MAASTITGHFVHGLPMVRAAIQVGNVRTTETFEMLLASGTPHCILDTEITPFVGLNEPDFCVGTRTVHVPPGKPHDVYFYRVTLLVRSSAGGVAGPVHAIKTEVGFGSKEDTRGFAGMLGQVGFFDKFDDVVVNFREQTVALRLPH